MKALLVIIAFASLEGFAKGGELLAKPARVPFAEGEIGVILVHVSEPQCPPNSPVHIADERRLVESWTHFGDIASSHTDRFGLHWMHVSVDLRRLPLGATRLKVTACGSSVFTKARVLHTLIASYVQFLLQS